MGDVCVCHRCSECGVMLEEYSDEEIGIMVIILGTFIHREPGLAAPFLPEILSTVTKYNKLIWVNFCLLNVCFKTLQICYAFYVPMAIC